MKSRKKTEGESRPINLVLLAISFIIFGVLGIVFITQMELQPGWAWEDMRDIYPLHLDSFQTDDVNKNGNDDIISYAGIQRTDRPEKYLTPQYGGVYCLDGVKGNLIWKKEYNGPVKKVFPLMDVDNDGTIDYFISKASVAADWKLQDDEYEPDLILNMYTNHILNGSLGEELIDYEFNFTNFYIHDLVVIDDILGDQHEDLLMLECKEYEVYNPWEDRNDIKYEGNISSYFINGTKTNNIHVFNQSFSSDSNIPGLEIFNYIGESHVLFIGSTSLVLLNTNEISFLNPIYNITFYEQIIEYEIIEDFNSDEISEILILLSNGSISLIDGSTGVEIRQFNVDYLSSADGIGKVGLSEIHSPPYEDDNSVYILLDARFRPVEDSPDDKLMRVYRMDISFEEILWEVIIPEIEGEVEIFVLNEDLNGDLIEEIIYFREHQPFLSQNEVARYSIINVINGKELAVINTEYHADSLTTINDIDGDGKKDYLISGDDRVIAISSRKPMGLWLSPAFPLGLPLFIVLVILSAVGILIVILRGKRLDYKRHKIKEHKFTVAVNILAIALMTITFFLFLLLMNIFNNTLIVGTDNTNILVVFLVVIITWYGALPLTAALYNRFAPQFAYIFIKLRDIFFKISRGYKNEIFVLDMKDRKDIGIVIQLKRLILPLLLSISVGFYSYDVLTRTLEYPKSFELFGSTEFFKFLMGYMLCCVLPMILSFVLFSFFISGNFLLDDAGVVYYREHKKYRQPADIEPVSIWAQSIVKGIAGLSALLTFSTFLVTVDLSGFFGDEGEPFMVIFGLLFIFVFFVGIPFLTAFSYVLLAGEVMDMCVDDNKQKLYARMEKYGYDTKPRDITNIYPSSSQTAESNPPET
ncbi:MAG: hypothetical protein ACFFA0_15000 [Promethearchaeota archaeon]